MDKAVAICRIDRPSTVHRCFTLFSRASSLSFVMAGLLPDLPKTAIRSCISRRKDGADHWFIAGYCPHSACISRGWARCAGKTSGNISNLKGHLGLYLAKNEDVFLNSVKGFDEHLGLYLTGRESLAPLFSPPPPFFLVIGVLLSPHLDYIIPAKPVIRILSVKNAYCSRSYDPSGTQPNTSSGALRLFCPARTSCRSSHIASFPPSSFVLLNFVMASLYRF